MDNEYSILEDSLRNTFGSVAWSHKIQEKQADIYFLKYKCMETIKIAEVLDNFEKICNSISEGLPAEIEARKKQYEFYRDKLLTFKQL